MKRFILVLAMLLVCVPFAQAQVKVEKLKYPTLATTTQDKLEFCYIAQEKLRIEHNAKGKDYRDGKISKAQWEAYLKDSFMEKSVAITRDLVIQKNALKKSIKYEVDLNDLEKN